MSTTGPTDSKEGSPPTCSSLPYAAYDPPLLRLLQVNNAVWYFLDYVEDIIYLLVAHFGLLLIFNLDPFVFIVTYILTLPAFTTYTVLNIEY